MALEVTGAIRPDSDFFKRLGREVKQSLSELSHEPRQMNPLVFKAAYLFALWFVFYGLFLILGPTHIAYALTFAVLWALTMMVIQFSVMHDASHGALSESRWMNVFLTLPMSFIGGSSLLWIKQHCKAHYSNTNVHGLDKDIDTNGLLRLHTSQPLKSVPTLIHPLNALHGSILDKNTYRERVEIGV